MKSSLLSLTFVSLLLAGTAARADVLTITLSSPFQSGEAKEYVFNATVTNTTNQVVFLNGDSRNVDSPLTLDDSPFLNDFPFSLGAGASFTGELFDVFVPSGTPRGLYAGAFEIIGGFDDSAQSSIGSADFDVQVTPEPSSVLLLATGALSSVLCRRRYGIAAGRTGAH